jgi:succinyl-diaminopimelate desuccinylase
MSAAGDRVLAVIDASRDEIVDFTAALIRVPTINPPGEDYTKCARLIGNRLTAGGFVVDYIPAIGRPEHTKQFPRVNVVGFKRGKEDHPLVHLNGHYDVVPAGAGWTFDPFAGTVRDGRIYGRGACDMKSGIASAVYAVEAIRRAGVPLNGSIEISATPDEESGGFAGVAYITKQERFTSPRIDHVIIPEPLNVDRICIGHRGAYWFEVETRGRIGHGSMPFLGVNAIDHMTLILDRVQREWVPSLANRTTAMPVVPAGARQATLNINGIFGGQPIGGIQTPCVADRCAVVFDRRFLLEESFAEVKQEIETLLASVQKDHPGIDYELRDVMIVPPVRTPEDSPLIGSLERHIQAVLKRPAQQVASPGTYDHKHFDRLAGIKNCVAYGPGVLDIAHQPDEWCAIDDLVNATKVLALTVLDLTNSL